MLLKSKHMHCNHNFYQILKYKTSTKPFIRLGVFLGGGVLYSHSGDPLEMTCILSCILIDFNMIEVFL